MFNLNENNRFVMAQQPQADEAAALGARRIHDVLQAAGAGMLPPENLPASGHWIPLDAMG